jgi:chitodextrinase
MAHRSPTLIRATPVPAARRRDNTMSRLSTLVIALACAVLWLSAPIPAHAADDVTPPTMPGTPTFSSVTPFSVTLTWAHATDDVAVTHYLIRRNLLNGQTWTDSATGDTDTVTISDLTPNQSYTFTLIATDAAANTTAAPAATVRTPSYTAGPMCSVTYQQAGSGGGSFYATVAMTNLSPGAWQEWTLGFTLAGSQRINPEWGFQQNGTRWTADFVWLWSSAAGPLLPGGARSATFAGTYTDANPPPTDLTINGHPCDAAPQPVPPGPPQNLVVTGLTPGAISIRWSAATPGVNPISRYEVLVNGLRYTCIGVDPLACAISGLTPGATYSIAVRAVDSTGLVGPATTIIAVRTPPSTPPSAPGSLAVSAITTTGATLAWSASTPGSFPLTGYVIYRVDGGVETAVSVTPNATTTATLSGLTPATPYTLRIRARDTAGVLSAPSAPVSFTTRPAGGCDVAYRANDWGGGFTANMKITNTGATTIDNWTLRFTFPAGQRVTHGWNATWSQPAATSNVAATSLGWNSTIQPGQSVDIGFNGAYSATNPPPSAFTLNAGACTVS